MDKKHTSASLNKLCVILSSIIKADFLIADYNLQKISSSYSDDSAESQSKITVSSIITNVVKTGKPVILNRTHENPGCNVCPEQPTCKVSGFIGVPIKQGDQILGAMAMIAPIARSINMFGTLQNAIDTLENAAQIAAMVLGGEFDSDSVSEAQFLLEFLPGVSVVSVDRDGALLSKRGSTSEPFWEEAARIEDVFPLAVPLSRSTVQTFFYAALEPDGFFGHVTWIPGDKESLCILRSRKRPSSPVTQAALEECRALPFRHLPPYQALLERADRLSCSQLPILLSGPQGSGKGLFASYIHVNSSRSGSPLLFIDCQNLPPLSQVEAVFGSEGSLPETGLLWQAPYGTVCFQNIEFMSYSLQEKLCDILEYKLPLKRQGLYGHCNLRLLFDSCFSLMELRSNSLLTDRLFSVLEDHALDLPDLKPGSPKLFPIFESILNAYSEKRRCNRLSLSEELKQAICARPWTRLEDLYRIAEMIVNSVEKHTLLLSDIPVLQKGVPNLSAKSQEDEQLLRLLEQKVNKTEIAKQLSISRATLYRRLRKLGLEP